TSAIAPAASATIPAVLLSPSTAGEDTSRGLRRGASLEQRGVRRRVVVDLRLARDRRDGHLDRARAARRGRLSQLHACGRLLARGRAGDDSLRSERRSGAADLDGHLDVRLVVGAAVREAHRERRRRVRGYLVRAAAAERDAVDADRVERVAVQTRCRSAVRTARGGGAELAADERRAQPLDRRQELGVWLHLLTGGAVVAGGDAVVLQPLEDQRRDALRVDHVGGV